MLLKSLVYVALLGALGAIGRYLLSGWTYRLLGTGFPYGTLVVNLVGCFLLGCLMELGLTTDAISPTARAALAMGFLGSFTTFSTFGYETFRHLEAGQWELAVANAAANLLLGLAAVWAGISVVRYLG